MHVGFQGPLQVFHGPWLGSGPLGGLLPPLCIVSFWQPVQPYPFGVGWHWIDVRIAPVVLRSRVRCCFGKAIRHLVPYDASMGFHLDECGAYWWDHLCSGLDAVDDELKQLLMFMAVQGGWPVYRSPNCGQARAAVCCDAGHV